MNETTFVFAGLLLGLYVLFAGIYGLAYALYRLKASNLFGIFSLIFFAVHLIFALAITLWTPLGFGWKLFIWAGSFGFLFFPSLAWLLLQNTHDSERNNEL